MPLLRRIATAGDPRRRLIDANWYTERPPLTSSEYATPNAK